jgi:hypothetical protein
MQISHSFSERQQFRQTWLIIFFLVLNAFFVSVVVVQVVFGHPVGNNPASDTMLIVMAALFLLLSGFMLTLRLESRIDATGVHYRFFPLQRAMKTITWDRISEARVRAYSPLAEYGGWGIRVSLSGNGTAFNVSGNQGLQLTYDNGKKFLIGTQIPEELASAVEKFREL